MLRKRRLAGGAALSDVQAGWANPAQMIAPLLDADDYGTRLNALAACGERADRATRKLTAHGHIELQETDGKITKAEEMNLHETLRDAFVAYVRRQNIRIDR